MREADLDLLVRRFREGLESGAVDPADVERLLAGRRRTRAGAPDLLRAVGFLVVFAAVALLYATQYEGLPATAKLTTPFAFPAAALAAAVLLHRRGRPAWEVIAAGLTGYIGLAAAWAAAAGGLHDPGPGYGALAGAVSTAIVLLVHFEVRAVRLTAWVLPIPAIAAASFGASYLGIPEGSLEWVALAEAGLALSAGVVLRRAARVFSDPMFAAAALLLYLSSLIGTAWSHSLSPWHGVMSVAVVATIVAASALDIAGLAYIGALGGLLWLGLVAELVGSRASWALVVALFGVGLVLLSLLIRRVHRQSRPQPAGTVAPPSS